MIPSSYSQVEKMRLSNINRRNMLRKLEQNLRQKEKLADGGSIYSCSLAMHANSPSAEHEASAMPLCF